MCPSSPSRPTAVVCVNDFMALGVPRRLKERGLTVPEVHLLDGPFKKAFEDNAGFLLKLEPDRLLHRFLAFNGLPPKGEVSAGWEAEGLSGHALGAGPVAVSLNGKPLRVAAKPGQYIKPLRVEDLSYAVPESLGRRPGKLMVWIVPQPRKAGPAIFAAALIEKP